MFGEILWRSQALATAGGAVIGFFGGPAVIFMHTGKSDPVFHLIYFGWLGCIVGTAIGLFFGFAAGLLLGAAGSMFLVPYRGQKRTVRSMQVLATLLVGAWFPLITNSNVYDDPSSAGLWVIIAPSVVAAWFVSPGVVIWYVKRMRGAEN